MIYRDKLKQIRERFGVTQVSLAKKLNVSKSCYSQYEQEKDTMPLKHLITVVNTLNVSLDFIFELNDSLQYDTNHDVNLKLSGLRLKELRKNNHLTQEELAKKLNIAKSMIGAYEHGEYFISTHALYALCKKFNISADYLLGKIDNPIYFK